MEEGVDWSLLNGKKGDNKKFRDGLKRRYYS